MQLLQKLLWAVELVLAAQCAFPNLCRETPGMHLVLSLSESIGGLCSSSGLTFRFLRIKSARCCTPHPPLQSPPLARDGLPGGGGGDSRQVTVSGGGGGLQGYLTADTKTASSATVGDRGTFWWAGTAHQLHNILGTIATMGLGFKKASNVDCKLPFRCTFAATVGRVGCAGVWGCEAMGVTSVDSGDLGDTASSLES